VKTYGITGGIGMGKSTAGQLLRERGVAVVDTDDLARELVQPGEPALTEIQNAFGPNLLASDGQLKRGDLATLIFRDRTVREKLEAILHPRIHERWQAQLEVWRGAGRERAAVIIPLLFETGAESDFDAVICVACTAATQEERLRARGWTVEQIEQRIAAQMPVAEKMGRSHHVIWTEGGLDVHAQQWERALNVHHPNF
jgi:dephospho-CoA kinase